MSLTPLINIHSPKSPRIWEKFEMVLMGYSGSGENWFMKKTISCQTPFNMAFCHFVGRRNVWCPSPPCRRKTPPCFASITTTAACITTTTTPSIIRRRWASAIRPFRRRRFTATRRRRRRPHRWTAAVPGSRFHRRRLPVESRRITSCRSTARPPRYKEWQVHW